MDPLTIAMLAVLAVLVFFMFRNSRKRKAQQEDLRKQIVPGAEVMTNFGLYGTLVSLDDVSKVAELEVAPGNIVRVHSQTIAKVVDEVVAPDGTVTAGEPRSVEEAMAIANREEAEREAAKAKDAAEPAYGERVADTDAEPTVEVKKPVRRTTKKTAE